MDSSPARSSDGVHEAVALVEDPALVERAIRRAATSLKKSSVFVLVAGVARGL